MYVIIISSKKDSGFIQNAKVILESNEYAAINENTYIGSKQASAIVKQLKQDAVYKKEKTSKGIEIYFGSVVK